MALVVLSLIIWIALGVWSTVLRCFSLSCKSLRICETTLLSVGIAGAVGAAASYFLFLFTFMGGGNDAQFLRDTFYSFALAVGGISLVGILVAAVAILVKSKFRPLIVPVMSLWSVIGLGVVFAGNVWIGYSDSLCALYFTLFGVCVVALLSFGSYFELRCRREFLADERNIYIIKENKKARLIERQKKREAAKRLKEKKNRLKG